MKTAQEASKIWVKKSLQAYLEGEKDINWIVGILRGSRGSLRATEIQAIQDILSSLGPYGLAERRDELQHWLDFETTGEQLAQDFIDNLKRNTLKEKKAQG